MAAGEIVIKEGDEGDYFYAIDTGKFVASKNGEQKFVYNGTGKWKYLTSMQEWFLD